MLILEGCATPQTTTLAVSGNPDDLLIVDCLLPGQVRQLGTKILYLSARRPIKTSAARCQISGGEYVSFDRADAGSSLKIWLPRAEDGDPQAQTYVGEIFEKGLGVEPDYEIAANWYRKASMQNYTRASINLGYLYESGLGVGQDLTVAMNLYREASGIEDGSLEYVSTVEFANREIAKRETVLLESQVNELSQQLADSEARYRSVKNQVRADQVTLKELNEKIQAKRNELTAEYQNSSVAEDTPEATKALIEINAVRAQLESEMSDNKILDKKILANRDEIKSLRTGLIADSQKIQQLKSQLATQVNLVTSLESSLELSTAGDAQVQAQNALDVARGDATRIQNNVSKLRKLDNAIPDSVVSALGAAEARELVLASVLATRTKTLNTLRRRQVELESTYKENINSIQTELNLSRSEQSRVASRLADSELSVLSIKSENEQLRDRLRSQNEEVANREREQMRLSAKLAVLSLSEKASRAEKRAADATTKVANAELTIARLEQSRLVTKLVEAQLVAKQDKLTAAEQLAFLEKRLTIQTGVVANRQQQISLLEGSVTEGRAQARTISAEAVIQVVALGPSIEIIEPPVLVTRGPGEIIAQADGTVDLIGRITPADRLLKFSINGERVDLTKTGVFNYRSSEPLERIEITAVDDAGERTSVSFSVARRVSIESPGQVTGSRTVENQDNTDIDFGSYHAIIVGNNRYSDMSDLRTAETDAKVIDAILRKKYGFSTQLLLNATKLEILTAFNNVQENLTNKDNLIVYYAGHGQIDPEGDRGFWLPVDAEVNNSEHWISNAVVTNYLDSIPAKQIMVIADSCFSGTLTKASIPRMQTDMPANLRAKWLALMSKRKVRTVLSSGGVKPVYDGIEDHSLFAKAFINQLSGNQGVLEGHRLYTDIRQEVQLSAAALGVEQVPQYAAIKHAGHEAGEFLFVSR
jgi:hypothetical protein